MDVASGEVECIRRSDKEHEAINILSHDNHALYIKIIDMLQIKYQCAKCEMIFVSSVKLRDHAKNHCEPDSLTEAVRCFVNADPKALLTDMFEYIADVAVEIQKYNVEKYETLLRKIINTYRLTGVEIPGANLGKTYKWNDVDSWIKEGKYFSFFDFHRSLAFGKNRSDYGRIKQQLDQVPVFGFNSGRYDINLIKSDLFAVIGTDNVKSVIKNPSYIALPHRI
ncbi:unnamed protein product [Phytophthora lilii]|uniref:Unnamed protein product n=1 Tax=Phytophthora lilii TaxID=2077276 RepID=A0A9W6WP67_9STRA|nr:unnamed protein product [Phytophthora lilii]